MMKIQWSSVRMFHIAIHLWMLGFMISAMGSAEWLWSFPVSPQLHVPGKLGWCTHLLSHWFPGWVELLAPVVLIILSIRGIFRPSRWWSAVLIWFIYTNLMNRAWMAGSGGQQLMANVLFWNIFLSFGSGRSQAKEVITTAAFCIIRGQLILTYFVTGAHKLTGTHWLDGSALGIAVTDQAFGPAWLAAVPSAAMALTYVVLVMQFALPVLVWFNTTRVPILIFGAVFHLATALFMDIPDMGLAFIAVYPIWLSDRESEWLDRTRSQV